MIEIHLLYIYSYILHIDPLINMVDICNLKNVLKKIHTYNSRFKLSIIKIC